MRLAVDTDKNEVVASSLRSHLAACIHHFRMALLDRAARLNTKTAIAAVAAFDVSAENICSLPDFYSAIGPAIALLAEAELAHVQPRKTNLGRKNPNAGRKCRVEVHGDAK